MKKILSLILVVTFISFSFAGHSADLVKPKIEKSDTFSKVQNVVLVATNDFYDFNFQDSKILKPSLSLVFVDFVSDKKVVSFYNKMPECGEIFSRDNYFESYNYKNYLSYNYHKSKKMQRSQYSNWRR